jgi:hypothetical protein
MPLMKSRRTDAPKFGGGSICSAGMVDHGADGVDQQAQLQAFAARAWRRR